MEKVYGDAGLTLRRLIASTGRVGEVLLRVGFEPIRRSTLVVDALFGTGLSRSVDPASLSGAAIEAINRSGAFVVSVDLPSGLNGSTAEIPGVHVRADMTVTFGYPKRAHAELPAAGACGRLVVAGIGLTALPSDGPAAVSAGDLCFLFPRRETQGHKGTYGSLAILGGAEGMAGAAGLAARAAHRAGTGKVTAVVDAPSREAVHLLSAETTTLPWGAPLDSFDAIAAGPGLGQSPEAAAVLEQVLAFGGPVLMDADALNLLARDPGVLVGREGRLLLTPHLGEAARLLGTGTPWVRDHREKAVREISSRFNAFVVLKGFRSLCASPDGRVLPVLAGNPGMATGGMGDALTGICGAFLARGMDPFWAAAAGAWVHGTAGDLALERRGGESLVASEVIQALPAALDEIRRCRVP
jgi:NAD(P)H-hydrate epimerase